MLTAVPHQLTGAVTSTTHSSSRTPIREVVEYIDTHLDDDLTAADLARVAGVGVRALQKRFQAAVGVSPLVYVRNARLERVRAELESGSDSVTDVAAKWGFYHSGRFAQQYRDRFGELPSATAKQASR
ncbi:helix-turn-helix transcriptional regulator [Gordonia sp. NPDC003424]